MERRSHLLIAAATCLAAAALVYALAFHTAAGRLADAITLRALVRLENDVTAAVANLVAQLGNPIPFALSVLALVAAALARGRPRAAALVAATTVGAAATSQVLKPLLAAHRTPDWLDRIHVSAASWPSGHTTAAVALALAVVVVAPPRLRPLAAVAGGSDHARLALPE